MGLAIQLKGGGNATVGNPNDLFHAKRNTRRMTDVTETLEIQHMLSGSRLRGLDRADSEETGNSGNYTGTYSSRNAYIDRVRDWALSTRLGVEVITHMLIRMNDQVHI